MKTELINPQKFIWAWRLSILVALGGALWAALGNQACDVCRDAASILGTYGFAWLGVGCYGILASLSAIFPPSNRLVTWMIFGAVGAHVVLLTLLVKAGLICPPCVLTGVGAFCAAAARLAAADFRPARDAWPLPIAAMFILGLVLHAQTARALEYKIVGDRLLAAVQREGIKPKPGEVLMILYFRPGCRHCADFEKTCLPKLQQALGNKLTIERRIAASDIPTPTVIFWGLDKQCLVGNQPCRVFIEVSKQL